MKEVDVDPTKYPEEAVNCNPAIEPEKKPNRRTLIVRFFNGELFSKKITPQTIGSFAILVMVAIFYINNRYDTQQQLLKISRLKVELQDIKYNALTQKAQVLHLSRQSKIEEDLKKRGSQLEIPSTPPFVINK